MAKDSLFREGETTSIIETNNLISEVKEAKEAKRAATNGLNSITYYICMFVHHIWFSL
jgi:hypothetical protein